MENKTPLSSEILSEYGFRYISPGAGGQDEWSGYGYWSRNDEIHFLGTSNGKELFYNRNIKFKFIYLEEIQDLYSALYKKDLTKF